MNCFILKSISASGLWTEFTLNDLPVPIDNKSFILMARPDSPILDLSNVRRGDPSTGLYEGDVILCDDETWLICYERGFYAINDAYVVRYFDKLTDFQYLGVRENFNISIPLKLKKKHMFRYNTTMFHMQDIIAAVHGKLLLNMFADPVSPDLICQECAFTYNNHKVFLGDSVGSDIIHLSNGRLTANGVDLAAQGGN